MTDGQVEAVCPQCGSAAAVHSIEELAALARARLGGQQQGYAAPQQQGYAAEPQQGPLPGWAQQPRSGPPPGPRSGPLPGGWQDGNRGRPTVSSGSDSSFGDSLGDDLAGAALSAAAGLIGRAIGRRVQRTFNDQVLPALAAKHEAMAREQIAIAERHPDLRACMTDQVVFLAGGSRVLPLANVSPTLTIEQSDALVARLRDG